MHPLCGANLATLLALLRANRPLARAALPRVTVALLAALGRAPMSGLERLMVAARRRALPPPEPPIFIVGHWRSGTTHLYNILSRAPDLGYVSPVATGLPWDFLLLAPLIRPLLERQLPRERFIDPIPVRPDSPQEDEIALANMGAPSFYHGLYFPARFFEHFARGTFFDGCRPEQIELWCRRHLYFMAKLALQQPGKRLVIKNPVYSARVALLRALSPGAKFIHIHRNPYLVYPSMRNFYAKLLQEFALQDADPALDEFILVTYARMLDRLVEDAATLPRGDFVELAFADFEADPIGQLQQVYERLGLDGFDAARPGFQAYLATLEPYPKRRYVAARQERQLVERHCGRFLDRWGYDFPTADGAPLEGPRAAPGSAAGCAGG